PDFWYNDGDIVLRTTSPTTHTLFRVDKRILARTSLFFESTFSDGESPLDAGSERYEDVPILDMPGDAAEDPCNNTLRFLLRPHSFAAIKRGLAFPATHAGALKLAVKYIFDDVHAAILQVLSEAWPTSLQAWDARSRALTASIPT
ncbi:hypothetical protein OF83DRAFT_1046057, partial [Amylostereum chailletii]